MKLKSFILPILLLTPLLSTSCDSGDGQLSGVTLDAYEIVFAYSNECSTTITIPETPKIEFVDDFKKEYFVFDNEDDIKGKSYEVTRDSATKITIKLTGTYSNPILQDESKEINYKIKKNAFKNNRLKEDASGKMYLHVDKSDIVKENPGTDSISFDCNFTFSGENIPTTKITIGKEIPEEPISLKNYCVSANNGETIKFVRLIEEGSVNLTIELNNLVGDSYAFNLVNKKDCAPFDNLVDDYGFNIIVSKNSSNYYFVQTDPMYVQKA